MNQKELQLRMRAICFAFLTPFYFLKAGSLIDAHALLAGAGLIALFLAMKMITKFAGILPLTRYFNLDRREGMYTTPSFRKDRRQTQRAPGNAFYAATKAGRWADDYIGHG
jgi:Kef-type K+ transport system membrane component KefB